MRMEPFRKEALLTTVPPVQQSPIDSQDLSRSLSLSFFLSLSAPRKNQVRENQEESPLQNPTMNADFQTPEIFAEVTNL
jgi:hypothetical protein